MYFDTHTHKAIKQAIINVDDTGLELQSEYFYSTGIHPWKLDTENIGTEMHLIEELHANQNVIAIGECGIDRSINISIDFQRKVFLWHLELAQKIQKPIIIHSVRAYSDMIELLQNIRFDGDLIFHDYRGNIFQTEKLNQFNTYYSFGKSLLKPTKKIKETLCSISPEQILFETDTCEFSIEKIYICAAQILEINLKELESIVLQNICRLYGNSVAGKNRTFNKKNRN